MPPQISAVIVSGDIVIDRHLYEGRRRVLQDTSPRGTFMVEEAGGAALTQRLIEAVFDADREERWQAVLSQARINGKLELPPEQAPICRLACKLPAETASPWPERLIGYALWTPQPKGKDQVWRVEKALGYGALWTEPVFEVAKDLPANPGIVVLDDAGDAFRSKQNERHWHLPLDNAESAAALPTWIVLKLGGSIGHGDLWYHLLDCEPRQRLVIVVAAQLLRSKDVRLSSGLSWEDTVEDLLSELDRDELRPLCAARHLIVHFEHDGAAWIDFTYPNQPQARLIFDAENAEGEWASRIEGDAFGYTTCLTAAIVQSLAWAASDLQPAIERGLSAMRNLREEGHGVAIAEKSGAEPGRGFPVARLAREILYPTHRFIRTTVPWEKPAGATPPWSILASMQNPFEATRPLYGFARQLAIQGEPVLSHVPHLRVGKLLTAGREEMEALRGLRRLMIAYRNKPSAERPLSIGVFGAPGAGKSFGVKQLALGIFGEPGAKDYKGWMEFNLSQFADSRDLIGAFHQVRDRVLQGETPVVFWDEFDSREYEWLQYLLAPMQDGRFQEGQITHQLGKCVFVFAGGTAWAFEEFGPRPDDADGVRRFKLAKGPDFKSRLDGYINVLGPNQRTLLAAKRKTRPEDSTDIFFPVRRALMIRSLLDCDANERLEIDQGLLTALLEIEDYRHGARSLTKVLEPFAAGRKAYRAPLRRSQLPAPDQLSAHVDSEKFYALCSRDLPFNTEQNIDKLARVIHETWRKVARSEGWTPKWDMPYDQLPADVKRSNEAAARRIPDILALVGLQVVRGEATAEGESRVRQQLKLHIETLAEEEHKGWMTHLYSEGWQFDEVRDDSKHRHDCLRPFHELKEKDKEKDRDSVRHYPDFVREAGFKIVFI